MNYTIDGKLVMVADFWTCTLEQ